MDINPSIFTPLSRVVLRFEDVFVSGSGAYLTPSLEFIDADFKPEQLIIRSGSKASKIWVHISGPANEAVHDLSSRRSKWRRVTKGQVFGITEAIIGVPFCANVETSGNSTFRYISSKELLAELVNKEGLRDNLLRVLAASYAQIIHDALTHRDV